MIIKNFIFVSILSIYSVYAFGQNKEGYDDMIKEIVHFDVPYAYAEQLKFELDRNMPPIILDAREEKEFNISHIPGAHLVGYNKFDLNTLKDLNKEAKIYVYCSIGYRSGDIANKLKNAGFTKVFNLYGGIFNWANQAYPMIEKNGNKTKQVHGYDKDWGKWLNNEKCIKKLD